MKFYTVTLRLLGPLAGAAAVEWTNRPVPVDGDAGWQPCLRQEDGSWRLSSRDLTVADQPHRRGPGHFGDLAIRYRLTPAGSWSPISDARKEIVIVGGEEFDASALDTTRILLRPALVAAPTLLGAGEVGAQVSVDPGAWSGAPAPTFAFQWLRDSAPIPGAVARTYLPLPLDDRTALSARVTALNAAGPTTATTPAMAITYAAPRQVRALPEEVFDQDSGPQLVETAQAFEGRNLTFSATEARIDSRTGVLTISTDQPFTGRIVSISATNSGGSATADFRVTVEAVPAFALSAQDVQVLRSEPRPVGATSTWSPILTFPGLAGVGVDAIQFTRVASNPVDGDWHTVTPTATLGEHALFHRDHPVRAGVVDPAVFSASSGDSFRLRWRRSPAEEWSPSSVIFTAPPLRGSEGEDIPATPTFPMTRLDLGDGVAVTLSKSMPCGQYWNGDWFIVNGAGSGGFTITSITPNSAQRAGNGTWRHGLMRNPMGNTNGLDGWTERGSQPYRLAYTHSLNICPAIAGRGAVAFTAGQEGSLVKAVGRDALYPSDVAGSTPIDHVKILTVVNAVPATGGFRPSPNGAVTSKAAPARIDQLRLDLIPQAAVSELPTTGGYSMQGALDAFRGPWLTSWLGASHFVHQLWARTSHAQLAQPIYADVVGPYLNNAYARLVDTNTSTANRQLLARRLVQIGLDLAIPRAATIARNFWPMVVAQPLIVAAALLPGASVMGETLKSRLGGMVPGNDPWQINLGAQGRAIFRVVTAADDTTLSSKAADRLLYIPISGRKPEEMHADADNSWPRHWPTTQEHIGLVHRYVIGRSGIGCQHDNRYKPIQSDVDIALAVALLIGGGPGGQAVADVPAIYWYADKLVEWRTGHFAGTWSMTPRRSLGFAQDREFSNTNDTWPPQWTATFYNAMRAISIAPLISAQPEQPFPPTLAMPAAGQLTVRLGRFTPGNGRPITGRQYRLRRIASRSDADVYATWSDAGPTSTAADRWRDFPTGATTATVTGLTAGIYQVQVRVRNSVGWSPSSTHIPALGTDADTAYRGVLDV
jgi:hypothetical protein